MGRQVLKHQSQPPPHVQVVFHRVRHLLVQQQRMVQRTVLEVSVVSGRVGWKVKRGARHGFLSGRSRGCPAIIQNDRAVGSSPVSILMAGDSCGDSEKRDSRVLKSSLIVGTPGQVCRLLSIHLRRDTLPDEIIGQYGGSGTWARTPGELDGGTVVWSTGVGDAIAQVLGQYSEENSDHA